MPEQRRASHILISITPENDKTAQQEAQQVLERLQKGESFEKVAKEVSKDAGSAKNGGDLGFLVAGLWIQLLNKRYFH